MIKVLELFSGYGGASFALKNANIPHKVIGYSDIEKCANYIYSLNHGSNIPQLGDVTLINPKDLEDFDLLTGGFPCQSFSIAGKREGFAAKNKGNLFFEIIRIAEIKKPRYMLLENVEGILSHDKGKTMRIVLEQLKGIGYIVKWSLMYSKDLGTPQTRPRVWFMCFRDWDDADKFMFPEKEKLKLTVKDLLEDEVPEKYYLNENQIKRILENDRHKSEMCIESDISSTLLSRDYKDGGKRVIVADYRYDEGLRVRKDGMCPTLTRTQKSGDGLSGCPIIRNTQQRSIYRLSCQKAIKEGKPLPCGTGILERYDGVAYSLGTTPGQIILTGLQKHQQIKNKGVCSTLNNAMGTGGGHIQMIYDSYNKKYKDDTNISNTLKSSGADPNIIKTNQWRRLTPRECFRLQGFFKDEIKFGNLSDSKLYFLAGNGWDINVVSKILTQLFKDNSNKQKQLFKYI